MVQEIRPQFVRYVHPNYFT